MSRPVDLSTGTLVALVFDPGTLAAEATAAADEILRRAFAAEREIARLQEALTEIGKAGEWEMPPALGASDETRFGRCVRIAHAALEGGQE